MRLRLKPLIKWRSGAALGAKSLSCAYAASTELGYRSALNPRREKKGLSPKQALKGLSAEQYPFNSAPSVQRTEGRALDDQSERRSRYTSAALKRRFRIPIASKQISDHQFSIINHQ
jgi:hypothetical protein